MRKKDAPPWFVARESGTSYVPATWQGYLVIIGYVVLVSASSLLIAKSWGLFFGAVADLTVVVFVIVGITTLSY